MLVKVARVAWEHDEDTEVGKKIQTRRREELEDKFEHDEHDDTTTMTR